VSRGDLEFFSTESFIERHENPRGRGAFWISPGSPTQSLVSVLYVREKYKRVSGQVESLQVMKWHRKGGPVAATVGDRVTRVGFFPVETTSEDLPCIAIEWVGNAGRYSTWSLRFHDNQNAPPSSIRTSPTDCHRTDLKILQQRPLGQ